MGKLYKIVSLEAHLRSAPRIERKTELTRLKHGQQMRSENAAVKGWPHVSADVQGTAVMGHVQQSVVRVVTSPDVPLPPAALPNIPEAHLTPTAAIRVTAASGRAFSLTGPTAPRRTPGEASALTAHVGCVIHYLNVERSARYRRGPGSTYCSSYAHDYAHLAGAYLPRVWWMRKSLGRVARDEAVPVHYGTTVAEMNATSLYTWLEEVGNEFGWRRSLDLDELQRAVNAGQVGIICAQRTERNQPGHSSAVVPETASQHTVRRAVTVTVPLQRQAGRTNTACFSRTWWTAKQLSTFG